MQTYNTSRSYITVRGNDGRPQITMLRKIQSSLRLNLVYWRAAAAELHVTCRYISSGLHADTCRKYTKVLMQFKKVRSTPLPLHSWRTVWPPSTEAVLVQPSVHL